MKITRVDLRNIIFSAFSIIALFMLLDPLIGETTKTLSVNTEKINLSLHMNFGWVWVYLLTLAVTFLLILFLMDKSKTWFFGLGTLLGSLVVVLEFYRVPGRGQLASLIGQKGSELHTYFPYFVVVVGTIVLVGLLKLCKKGSK
ncbi:MAG: hypothetical protein GX050_10975 [Firmicutes bacterium]|nr:hypothetical protein [Bacillota bacterium]